MPVITCTTEHGGNVVNAPSNGQQAPQTYSPVLNALLDRASQGDPSTLPDLKRAFDEHPELVRVFGDMTAHAEESLLTLLAGSCLTAREAVRRQADELRESLLKTTHLPLERLLVDRITLSWMLVGHADLDLARQLQTTGTGPQVDAAEKRLDRAQARLVSAVKALGQVQKLLRPALSPLDIATRSGTARPAAVNRRNRPVSLADPISN